MSYDLHVALGEAYVVVRADLRPFTRDLRRELKKSVEDFERDLNKHLGVSLGRDAEKAGESAGERISKGLKHKLGDKRHSPWVNVTAALASALDDGISALPTEVKATIVGGILAASPFIAAALSGVVSAGLGAGVVGLGVALASQYEPVQDRFAEFLSETRLSLVRSAAVFGPALLRTLDSAQDRIESWEPLLERIFSRAAPLLEPLVSGALGAVEELLNSIDLSFDDVEGFVYVLADGFEELGSAIGDALEILAATGEEGQEGLEDLIDLTASAIRGFAGLVWVLTEAYGILRDIYILMSPLNTVLAQFGGGMNKYDEAVWVAGQDTEETTEHFKNLITATEREEKAAKEAAKAIEEQARAIEKARDAAFESIDVNIDYERSLDRLHDSLNENGRTLDITTESGRRNVEALGDAIRDAQKRAEDGFQKGKLNAFEARKLYQDELADIYRLAAAHGITKKRVDEVYGSLLDLLNLPNPSPDAWAAYQRQAKATADELARSVRQAQRLRDFAARGIPNAIRWGAGHVEGMADGGMVTKDSLIRAGEGDKPEVVIPLTKPQRAMQLAERSGLTRILGNVGNTVVQVFVGDEPLEQKMFRVVQGNNRALGMGLAHGAR